jgi:predicted ATPase
MIEEVHLVNFRAFRDFTVSKLGGVNVIVGDNGVGKTALLEAIFLTLCTSPQKAVVLRQSRGLDGYFSGAPADIIDSFYADLFRNMDMGSQINITLKGDGPEHRSLIITRGRTNVILREGAKRIEQAETVSPFIFEWVDEHGVPHRGETRITSAGAEWESTDEDRPNFFFYAATTLVPSGETAARFSDLRKKNKQKKFIKIFTDTFPWIEEMAVLTYGGAPVLHAQIRGLDSMMPLTSVSGAINRVAAILLAIAARQDGVVLVDEIENGIYFKNQQPLLKALLDMSREYNCQLFLTTHSSEWLDALAAVAGTDFEDVVLYRMTRGDEQPELSRIGSKTFLAGLRSTGELR